VENKADLAGSRAPALNSSLTKVRTSALTGAGLEELKAEILRKVGSESGVQPEAGFLTNIRQQGLVQGSLKALGAARAAVHLSTPHEMLLMDLYNALRPLDEITGATTNDDILSLIFSTFCIGK
jgi:tRNA modification GTPase